MRDEGRASRREQRERQRRAAAVGLLTVVTLVAVPVLIGLGRDATRQEEQATERGALLAVRAAVGKTVAAGSYEMDTETSSTSPTAGLQCPANASCPNAGGTSMFGATSHGIVHLDPYVARIDSDDSYGTHTLYVTSTTVWLSGSSIGAAGGSGIPLSSFASSVESALGSSPGALAMIGLASPGGSLNLEQAAVADATPAGSGSVGETSVTYYDVTIDMTKLADTPDLSDVQRATIQAALPRLRQGGYSGTTERIGVDDAGFIREVTATNHFTDGSTGTRHTVLSNFGCAPPLRTPDQPALAATPAAPCVSPDTPTTTSTPATSAPTTSAPPTSTTSTPPTSTTSTPTTVP